MHSENSCKNAVFVKIFYTEEFTYDGVLDENTTIRPFKMGQTAAVRNKVQQNEQLHVV